MEQYAVIHKWDNRQQPIADVTNINHQEYCSRYGYRIINDILEYDHTRNGMWMKWVAMLRALENPEYADIEWFFWTDNDVLFMNMNTSLDNIRERSDNRDADFIASKWHIEGSPSFSNLRGDITKDKNALDWFTIHTGNVFVRNCQWSADFIRSVYEDSRFKTIPSLRDHPTGDEIGFTIYYMGYPEYRSHIGFVPIDYVHSIDPEMRIAKPANALKVYQPGDFIFHAAFIPMEKKIELLTKYSNLVVR